jgi:uncharacterized membrane protein
VTTSGVGSAFLMVPIIISWLMVPVGIVLIIVGLVRYFWPREDDPTVILQRRYARGEISQSEHQALLEDLDGEERQP